MSAPRRASGVRTLTRSPEPSRVAQWVVDEWAGHWGMSPKFDWTCLVCESGTGQAPTHALATEAAEVHWRANHNHQTPQP